MTSNRSLRRSTALHRLLTLGLLAVAALAFTAAKAHAAGESITLTQNDPTAVAGRATNFTAAGTLNPDDTMFGFDIFVFLKDPTKDPTCASTFDEESATAMHSGGNETWISPATGFQVGMGPSFDQPFKITFTGSGPYLLCGYVNGDFSTFASGELRGAVTAQAARPAVLRRPWITRRGHALTCHPGTWSNAPASLGYRWYVKGHSRRIASGRKLRVRRALTGRRVLCRVTAANAAGRRTASSRAVRAR
jgi:hypothetical protein